MTCINIVVYYNFYAIHDDRKYNSECKWDDDQEHGSPWEIWRTPTVGHNQIQSYQKEKYGGKLAFPAIKAKWANWRQFKASLYDDGAKSKKTS